MGSDTNGTERTTRPDADRIREELDAADRFWRRAYDLSGINEQDRNTLDGIRYALQWVLQEDLNHKPYAADAPVELVLETGGDEKAEERGDLPSGEEERQ